MNLWEVWDQTVSEGPGELAWVDALTGDSLTRNKLRDEAEKLSRSFPPLERQVVALAEPNGPAWLQAFLALQKAGAVLMPLDSGLPPGRLPDAAREQGASFLYGSGRVQPLEPIPGVSLPPVGVGVCLLNLTSGTTGVPRALPFTTSQMLADGRQVCVGMGIQPSDVSFGAIPFGHSYGLGNLVMPLIGQGTAVAISSENFPGGIGQEIARSRATIFPSVPTILRALTESAAVQPGLLAQLRVIISAGAFLRPDVATGFYVKFEKHLHNFYGSTETGGIAYDAEGLATLSGRSVGKSLPSVVVKLDAPSGDRVRVTSPAVTDPGTHLLADRGAWNEHGELCLLGRAGPVANVGGRKVDPAEVERVLRDLPGVRDAWVGVRTRASGDDYLVSAVETNLDRAKVLTLLNSRLPAWQTPRQLLTLSLFPRNERGKVDRAALDSRLG